MIRILVVLLLIVFCILFFIYFRMNEKRQLENLRNTLQINNEQDVDKWLEKTQQELTEMIRNTNRNLESWSLSVTELHERIDKLKTIKTNFNKK